MKTRTTRVTLTKNSVSDSDCFDIEIADEDGEYVVVSCGINGNSISINPDEWPFLRDAIDRVFEEIAENESEGKLKKLLETPAPWDDEPYDPPSNVLAAVEEESGWIPWNGGEYPPEEAEFSQVTVRLRDGFIPEKVQVGWLWDWTRYGGENDIIAYKVVD